MAVEFWNNVVLFVGGLVAMAEACCCSGTPTPTPTPTPSPSPTAAPTPSPGACWCKYHWEVYWDCTLNSGAGGWGDPYQAGTTECIDPCSEQDWTYRDGSGNYCFYTKTTCLPECTCPTPTPEPPTGTPTVGPTGVPTLPPTGTAEPTASPTGTAEPTASPTGTAEPTATPTPTAVPCCLTYLGDGPPNPDCDCGGAVGYYGNYASAAAAIADCENAMAACAELGGCCGSYYTNQYAPNAWQLAVCCEGA